MELGSDASLSTSRCFHWRFDIDVEPPRHAETGKPGETRKMIGTGGEIIWKPQWVHLIWHIPKPPVMVALYRMVAAGAR